MPWYQAQDLTLGLTTFTENAAHRQTTTSARTGGVQGHQVGDAAIRRVQGTADGLCLSLVCLV